MSEKLNRFQEAIERNRARILEKTAIQDFQTYEQPLIESQENLDYQLGKIAEQNQQRQEDFQQVKDNEGLASDAELGTLWGDTKQIAGKFLEGGLKQVAGAGVDVGQFFTATKDASLPDEQAYATHQKTKQYEALDKEIRDLQTFNESVGSKVVNDRIAELTKKREQYAVTPEEMDNLHSVAIEESIYDRRTNKEILDTGDRGKIAADQADKLIEDFFDTGLVNKNDTRSDEATDAIMEVSEEGIEKIKQAKGFQETVSAVGELLANGGNAVLENKAGTFQIVAESLLPTVLMAVGGSAAIAGKALNYSLGLKVFNDSVDAFQEDNNRPPTGAELASMGGIALSYAVAGNVSDKIMVGASKPVTALVSKLGLKGAAETGQRTAGQVLKESAKRVGGAGLGIAGAGVVEGVQETYQTAVENRFGKLDFEDPLRVTPEEVTAGFIGAAGGVGIRGALETPSVTASTLKGTAAATGIAGSALANKATEASNYSNLGLKRERSKDESKTIREAVKSGDLSVFKDEEGTVTNPQGLVDTVLRQNSKRGITKEQFTENANQLVETKNQLLNQVTSLEEQLASDGLSKTQQEAYKKELASTQEALKYTVDAINNTNSFFQKQFVKPTQTEQKEETNQTESTPTEQPTVSEDAYTQARDTGDFTGLVDEDNNATDLPKYVGALHSRSISDDVSTEEKADLRLKASEQIDTAIAKYYELREKSNELEGPEADKLVDEARDLYYKIEEAKKANQRFTEQGGSSVAEEMDLTVSQLQQAEQEGNSSQAGVMAAHVVQTIKSDPSNVPATILEQLLKSKSLTDSQRAFVQSVIDTNQAVEESKVVGVSSDVFKGGEGKRGIEEYRQQLKASLDSNNTARVKKLTEQLETFYASKVQRYKDFKAAFDEVNSTGRVDGAAVKKVESTYKTLDGKNYRITLKSVNGFGKTVNGARVDAVGLHHLRKEFAASIAQAAETHIPKPTGKDTTVNELTSTSTKITENTDDTPPWDTGEDTTASNSKKVEPTPTTVTPPQGKSVDPKDVTGNTELRDAPYTTRYQNASGKKFTDSRSFGERLSKQLISPLKESNPDKWLKNIGSMIGAAVTNLNKDKTNNRGLLNRLVNLDKARQESVNKGDVEALVAEATQLVKDLKGTKKTKVSEKGATPNKPTNKKTSAKPRSLEELTALAQEEGFNLLKLSPEERVILQEHTGSNTAEGIISALTGKPTSKKKKPTKPVENKSPTESSVDPTVEKPQVTEQLDILNQDQTEEVIDDTELETKESAKFSKAVPSALKNRRNELVGHLLYRVHDRIKAWFRISNKPTRNPLQEEMLVDGDIVGFFQYDDDVLLERAAYNLTGVKDNAEVLTTAQKDLLLDLKKHYTQVEAYVQSNVNALRKGAKLYGDSTSVKLLEPFLRGIPANYTGKEHDKQFLLNPNAIGAMAVATYSWVAHNGRGTLYNKPQDINKMFGLEPDTPLDLDTFTELYNKGVPQSVIINEIGASFRNIIGLKIDNTQAPEAFQSRIEQTFGQLGLQMLSTSTESNGLGLLVRRDVPVEKINIEGLMAENAVSFYRTTTEGDTGRNGKISFLDTTSTEVTRITDTVADSDRLLGTLFDAPNRVKDPLLEKPKPRKLVDEDGNRILYKMKNSLSAISDYLVEALNREETDSWEFKPTTLGSLDRMSEGMQKWLFNYKPELIENSVVDFRDSMIAANNASLLGFEHFKNFRKSVADKSEQGKFYFKYFIANQMRAHIDSNTFNPQNSKSHKGLSAKSAWKQTIDPRNQEDVDKFHLGLAHALDLGVDKIGESQAIADVQQIIKSDEFLGAVEALETIQNQDDLSENQQADLEQKIKDYLDKFYVPFASKDHTMTAFSALVEFTEFKSAVQSDNTFVSTLAGEVDGIANGPILGLVFFGGGKDAIELAEKVAKGLISADPDVKNRDDWLKKSNGRDMYEENTHGLQKKLHDLLGKVKGENHKALSLVLSLFNSRNIKVGFDKENDTVNIEVKRNAGKPTTMVFSYGAGTKAIKAALFELFLDDIRTSLQQAYNAGDLTEANKVIHKYNTLLKLTNTRYAPTYIQFPESLEQLKEVSIRPNKALANYFSNYVGNSLIKVVEDNNSAFMENRKAVNHIVSLTNAIFVGLWKKRYNELLASKNKLNSKTQTNATLEDGLFEGELLTKNEVQSITESLMDMIPSVKTILSDKFEDRIFIQRNKRTSVIDAVGSSIPLEKLAVSLNLRNVKNIKVNAEGELIKGVTSSTYPNVTRPDDNLGVLGAIRIIQALGDATVAAKMLKEGNSVLSIFDGFYSEAGSQNSTAQQLNSFTADALKADPALDLLEVLNKAIKVYKPSVNDEVTEAVNRYMETINKNRKPSKKLSVNTLMKESAKTINEFTAVKNVFTDAIQHINQYYSDNGAHSTGTTKSLETPDTEFGSPNKKSITPPSDPSKYKIKVPKNTSLSALEAINNLATRSVTKIDGTIKPIINLLKRFKLLGGISVEFVKEVNGEVEHPNLSAAAYFQFMGGAVGVSQKNKDGSQIIFILQDEGGKYSYPVLLHEVIHAAINKALYSKDAKVQKYVVDPFMSIVLPAIEKRIRDTLANPNSTELDLVAANHIKNFVLTSDTGGKVYDREAIDEFIAYGLSDPAIRAYLLSTPVDLPANLVTSKSSEVLSIVKNAKDAIVKFVVDLFWSQSPSSTIDAKTVTALDYALFSSAGLIDLSNTLNTNNNGGSTMAAHHINAHNVAEATPIYIFDQLGKNEPTTEHTTVLRDILSSISFNLPTQLIKERNQDRGIYSSIDVYLDAVKSNSIPFLSDALVNGFNLTKQQAYVMEQIEVSTALALQDIKGARKDLDNLWVEARKKLTVQDFAYTGEQTLENAQKRYDYIFNPTETTKTTRNTPESLSGVTVDKRSQYLSRFLALGMTDPNFKEKLDGLTIERTERKNKKLSEKLRDIFNTVLDFWSSKFGSGVSSTNVGKRMEQLTSALSVIEANNRGQVADTLTRASDKVEDKVNTLIKDNTSKAAKKLVELAGNRNTLSALVSPIAAINNNTVNQQLTILKQANKRLFQGKQGLIGDIYNELKSQTKDNTRFFKLLRQVKYFVDTARRTAVEHSRGFLEDSFVNKLTRNQEESLTALFIETDMRVFLDNKSLLDLVGLVTSKDKRTQEISSLTNQLSSIDKRIVNEFNNHAHYLGYAIATGKNTFSGNLALNADLIVRRSPLASKLTSEQKLQALDIVDKLVSLYTVEYIDQDNQHKDMLDEVIKTELNRTDGTSGIDTLIRFHDITVKDALVTNFSNNHTLMRKGHIAQIMDDQRQIRFTNKSTSEDEIKDLVRRGYKKIEDTKVDPHASHEMNTLWMSKNDGLAPYNAMATSMGDIHRKGSSKEFTDGSVVGSMYATKQTNQRKLNAKVVDPSASKTTYSMPVYDDQGVVHSYRYEMSRDNRTVLLNQRREVIQLLSKMHADVVGKDETQKQNSNVVEALKLQYKDDLLSDRMGEYVDISSKSDEPEFKEIWKQLPQGMKDEVEKQFGQASIPIRRDLVNITFGYRKFRPSQLVENKAELRGIKKALAAGLDGGFSLISKQPIATMKKSEQVWESAISEVKNIWVIKNLFTLLGNDMSNMTVLFSHGMNLPTIIKRKVEGYNAIFSFQKHIKERDQWQYKLDMEMAKPQPNQQVVKNYKANIAVFEDRISSNPIRPMIEAGMFQTIAEDIDIDDSAFTPREMLMEYMDNKVGKFMPEGVKKVGKEVVMTKDSTGYKVLNHLTQTSDLVARYSLYKHFTESKTNPMNKEDAVKTVVEEFVYYDAPTSKMIQFTNDWGFLPFTKYYMRIQKVLYRNLSTKPARLLALAGLTNILDFWSIHDSWFMPWEVIDKVNNPVPDLFTAPSDIITLNAAGALLD